jgi:predicted phosphatase
VVLVEEYLPATISDYIYLSRAVGFPPITSSFVVSFLLKLMYVSPVQIVFLDAQEVELESRWRSRGSLDERLDYLQMQRTTLLSLSKKLSPCKVLYIDTTHRTIREVHELIVNHLVTP